MRVEVALERARSGVGEGPFWDEAGGALVGRHHGQGGPALGAGDGERHAGRCPTFPSAVVLRRGGRRPVALRDGLYFLDPRRAARAFCRPDADRPDNRTNEAKCDAQRRFWLGTMQNNLHPDGSARTDDRQHRRALPRPRRRQLHARGRRRRPLQHARLDRRRPDLLFADTLTGVISAFAVARRRPARRPAGVQRREAAGLSATARRSTPRAISGTRASPAAPGPLRPGRPGRPRHRAAGHQPDLLLLRRPRPEDPLRHLGTLRPERGAARAQPAEGAVLAMSPGVSGHAVRAVCRLRAVPSPSRPKGPPTPRAYARRSRSVADANEPSPMARRSPVRTVSSAGMPGPNAARQEISQSSAMSSRTRARK